MKPRLFPVLIGLARARPGQFAISSLAVFSHYLLLLVPGLVLQAFFDDLTGRAPSRLGPYTLIALLAAVAVARGIQGVANSVEQILRQASSVLMRRNLLAAILGRPAATALPASTGEAVGRLRDDVDVVSMALTYALDPLGMVVMLGSALAVLAHVSLLVTGVVIAPALLAMLLVNTLARRISAYRERAQQAGADVTGMIGDAFAAFSAIKGAGAEERVAARFAALGDARLLAVSRDVVLGQAVDALATNLSTIAVGGILLMIPAAVRQGTFTVGDFALFVSYLTRFATVTGYVGQYGRIYRQVLVSLRRLEPLLVGAPAGALVRQTAPPNLEAGAGLPLRELVVRGLTHRFASGGGVAEVDLNVPAGSFTVITGRVGAGKTTLLRTLLGLLPASAGEIRWNGAPVARPDLWMVPPRCAYTPQAPRLFTASLEENVLLGQPGGRPVAAAAARTATLEPDLGRLEAGLATEVGPRGMRLSGGQAQRVAAARMLARDTALMVFDDLSSALDVTTEAELWRRLRESHRGATLLAVSHRPSVLAMADQVVRLEAGRVVSVERRTP